MTKIYLHSIKITLHLTNCILIISGFFDDIKIYFYLIKINLYSTKYIFIISPFFRKLNIYLYSVKVNLYSLRNIFIIYIYIYIFHLSKIYLYFMNFSLNTFLLSIAGLPFVFTKIYLCVCVYMKTIP